MVRTLNGPGGVLFMAGHPVLVDVARDMSRALGKPVERPLVVHVGVHRNRPIERSDDTPHIGVQTEQITDINGQEMWKSLSQDHIAEIVDRFDAVLDLSEANAPAYAFLPEDARRKVHFGPHIFPETPPPFRPEGSGLVFVGTINRRRARLLSRIQTVSPVIIPPPRTFGKDLVRVLAEGAGVLNLHFQAGIYTEYPRLLKTVLNGKVLFSEPLAPPLVAGRHYLNPTDRPSHEEAETIYNTATELLCGQYSLHAFLQRVLRGFQSAPQPPMPL